jgi:hypothetical protein
MLQIVESDIRDERIRVLEKLLVVKKQNMTSPEIEYSHAFLTINNW